MQLRRDQFAAVREWLDEVEAFWGDQLASFKAHAERSHEGASSPMTSPEPPALPGDQAPVSVRVAVAQGRRVPTVHGRDRSMVAPSSIRPDHPARHGLPVPTLIRMMGMWWGDLMRSILEHAIEPGAASEESQKSGS